MKKYILIIHVVIVLFSIAQPIMAKDKIKGEYEVAKEGAWCWFADPRAIHYKNENGSINKSYIGYIDIHGNIKATQHDFITGETEEVLIRSWFQPDDHNNPTFLVLPDERVMVFYSRHTDERCFYYRVSEKKGDITTLGTEYKIHTQKNTTYPSPFILSDDPDHFYLLWRGVSWHPTIAKITLPDEKGAVKTVWGPKQIVQSTASRPYAKYTSNGKDKIYMAYTTGHPDPTMPNYIYLNYIDINTFELKDIKENVLSKIGEDLHHIAATVDYQKSYPDAVVDASQLRDWLWQVVLDKEQKPVIAMVTINGDKTSHDYYYAYWDGNQWKKVFLSNAGGHFHQTPHIEKCYSGGMAIDDQNTNEIYCSVPVEGKNGKVYEIVRYILGENKEIIKTDTLTRDSKLNNVRPYIIPNRGDSPLSMVWMYGNYYDWIVSKKRPLGYCTSIKSDYDLYSKSVDTTKGLVHKKEYKQEENVKKIKIPGTLTEFSVVADIALEPDNYKGLLIKAGDIEYQLNGETLKPYLMVGGQKYQSNNILGNSDSWKEYDKGTGGKWREPVKYSKVQLSLTSKNGILNIYINGLLSQSITIDSFKLKAIEVGKPLNSIYIYNAAVSCQTLKALLK
ncbi:BNR repeat-containing protein [Plebeiibacterium marinum]|uniref:BNR repeat-containing protein n=1 Tax=Plebeiibacterium marinum TaxID=2992111 RepID=A0AAE3MCU7_9BACT|nr:BNR repeat-containing protein [Plebeiobacterium marinum]MCW3805496.1 BNR repeat-containing protein [Plebeiobacterium marinum]